MNEPMVPFKKRLTEAMDKRGIRPVDLAKACNFSAATASHYMSGYTEPKSNRLYIIAKVLNVDEAWLMGYDVPMERNQSSYNDSILILSNSKSDKENVVIKDLKQSLLSEGIYLDSVNIKLISQFEKLNKNGKNEAIKRINELTYIPEYQLDNDEQVLNAAHKRTDINPTKEDLDHDQKLMEDDDLWDK